MTIHTIAKKSTAMKGCFVSLVFLLAACVNTKALHDDFSSDVAQTIPASWVSDFISGSVRENWLAQLRDTQLQQLVHDRLEYNPAVRIAAVDALKAYKQADVAAGGRLPEIALSLRASRTAQKEQPSATTVYGSLFSATVQLSWNVDFWGSLSNRQRAAMYEYQAALAHYARTLNTSVASIARAWFSLIAEQQIAAIDRQKVDISKILLAEAQSSYQLGLSSEFTFRNQQARLLAYNNQFQRRLHQVRQLRRELEIQLGKYPSATEHATLELPEITASAPAGLPSDILKRRADMLVARARLQAAYENIAQARAARFPSITLTASAGRSSKELNDLNNGNFTVLNLAGGLTLPLFSFGALKANEELARANADGASVQYVNALNNAFLETEQALDKEQSLREQLRLSEQAVQRYRHAAELASTEYRSGVVDFSVWANAEITASDAQVALVNLRNEYLANRIQLYLALGGSFNDAASEKLLQYTQE